MKKGLLAVVIPIALSQTQVQPGFEVASIKPSDTNARGFSVVPSAGGRLTLKNCSLKRLLAVAYHLQDFQVSGGPKWIDSDRYDIVAKAEESASLPEHQLVELLRPLLAERFKVVFQWETKQLPRYLLVVATSGSKLAEVKADGEPALDIRSRRMITSRRAPLSRLVETLSWVLGRAVVDQTGLTGVYDFKLEWTPDDLQPSEAGGTGGTPESGNSLFAAIQEQLGLRLGPQKGPVRILMVDRAEKPAEN